MLFSVDDSILIDRGIFADIGRVFKGAACTGQFPCNGIAAVVDVDRVIYIVSGAGMALLIEVNLRLYWKPWRRKHPFPSPSTHRVWIFLGKFALVILSVLSVCF